ncbi:MAG TPA: DUF4349 domain-containing protein [Acidimicrobiales bacterium]|nr:DUF4349 domain-containing protein [Acidimicrobiales bacterium]
MGKRIAAGIIVVVLAAVVGARIAGNEPVSQSSVKGQDSFLSPASAGSAATGGTVAAALAADTTASGNGAGDVATPLPQGLGAPRVVKTASVDVEVAEGRFDVAFSKVPSIAAAHGGFVSSSTSSQGGGENRPAAGSVVLRVPAEHFDVVRQELVGLGKLRSEQIKGDDVSAQLTDLDARLRNLRAQEEAIRLLMTRAKTIGETIEVQRQLGAVREQIEQLAAEQARLGDAVALSTLTVSLAEPGAIVVEEHEAAPLAHAVERALQGAQAVLAATIIGLGYVIPLGLLLALGWLAGRPFFGRRTGAVTPS